MTMKLVDDIQDAWRWFSMWALTVVVAFPAIWAEIPEDAKVLVPAEWQPWIPSLLAIAGMIGRVVDQKKGSAP